MDLQSLIAIALLILCSAFVGALARDILFAVHAKAWTERYFGFEDQEIDPDEYVAEITRDLPAYRPGTALAIREPVQAVLPVPARRGHQPRHGKQPGYLRMLEETDRLIARFDQGRTVTS